MHSLRPFQQEALQALDAPSAHVLCVAPTGAGKSLIYERAAQKPGRKTLLVTPLVALARQQFAKLAPYLPTEIAAGTKTANPGPKTAIWIISPERLQLHKATLSQWQPDFLVVDECHCLWEWGESFRPSFKLIPELLSAHEIRSSLWLTATLPPAARAELITALEPRKLIELGNFDLPPLLDLRVVRVPWPERATALLGWIQQQAEPGIVFVPTRPSAHRLQRLIHASGKRAVLYHAGLSHEERLNQERLLAQGLPDVIVATSAFGMGMDYRELRWVATWQAPPSLLALAQAIGRAGRDPTRPSQALVLWDLEDFRMNEWMTAGSTRKARQLAEVKNFLTQPLCRRNALKDHFDRIASPRPSCGRCDICAAQANLFKDEERLYGPHADPARITHDLCDVRYRLHA